MREMYETQVWSLSQEDPPEESMATHSSILTWRIPWIEEPGGLQSTGLQHNQHNLQLDTTEQLSTAQGQGRGRWRMDLGKGQKVNALTVTI